MFELLRDILTSPAGSFGFVFAVLGLLFYIAMKAGTVIEKFRSVPKLSDNIDKIKEDIAEIKAFIQISRQDNNKFVKAHSPLSLTEKGEMVATDLHIRDILNRQWSSLCKQISTKLNEGHNPYDIQEVCFEIGRTYSKILTENEFENVRLYAFKNGHNLADYDLLFGIVLRDMYFKEKNIKVEELDKYEKE